MTDFFCIKQSPSGNGAVTAKYMFHIIGTLQRKGKSFKKEHDHLLNKNSLKNTINTDFGGWRWIKFFLKDYF